MTLRDEVWDEVLVTIAERGRFKISRLSFNNSQRNTVYRVLKEMESKDWLFRRYERSPIWRPGEKALQRLQLTEKAHMLKGTDATKIDERKSERRPDPWED